MAERGGLGTCTADRAAELLEVERGQRRAHPWRVLDHRADDVVAEVADVVRFPVVLLPARVGGVRAALHERVRLRLDEIRQWLPELPKRAKHSLASGKSPA
jgi:hypothetical protein